MRTVSMSAGAALFLMATVALAGPRGLAMSDAGYLVTGYGMTVYTFDYDRPNQSNCDAMCAEYWPPFIAVNPASAGRGYSVVRRKDGRWQWAYKTRPLYQRVGDIKPGDTTGEGLGGVWRLVRD